MSSGAPAPFLSLAARAAVEDVAGTLTFSDVRRVFTDEGFDNPDAQCVLSKYAKLVGSAAQGAVCS